MKTMKEKTINNFYIRFIIILFTLLSVLDAYALNVSFVIGNSKIIRNGRKIKPEVNKKVISGDMIITGRGGLIVLNYKDGSKIEVKEKSRIKIGTKGRKDSEVISVIAGVVNGKFRKLMKGKERRIYTPTTVAGVRGTDFEVGVSDGAESRIELKKGKLEIRNPYGKIQLKENENAEVGVGENPLKKGGSENDISKWKSSKDKGLNNNPEQKGKKFRSYIGKFGERSKNAKRGINGFDNKIKKGDIKKKEDLERTGDEIDNLQRNVDDDIYLNEAANSSIEGIINRFKKDKKEMYDIFLKIKKESNKVLEQQRRNQEELRKVREAYKKAYDEIMGKYREYKDRIKDGLDKDRYKPKFNKDSYKPKLKK